MLLIKTSSSQHWPLHIHMLYLLCINRYISKVKDSDRRTGSAPKRHVILCIDEAVQGAGSETGTALGLTAYRAHK
jgi:hypothetical protein